MRELHVVALSEDGRSVLLAVRRDAQTGTFRVALDGKLSAALRGDLAREGEATPRDSTLTPKEIQARLRAGETAEEIAAEAGVAVARVERFSGPVFSERQRMIEEVRRAYLVRGRRGASAVPLGEAVDEQLAASTRPDSVRWGARREEDGQWFVQVEFFSRGRHKHGRWLWDPVKKLVHPVDPASVALGHLEAAPAKPHKDRPALVVSENAPKREAADGKAGRSKAPARKAVTVKKAMTAKAPTAKKAPTVKKALPVRGTTPVSPAASTATAGRAATAKPTAGKATVSTWTGAKPVATKPVATKPVAAKPVATKPVATKPVAAKPVAAKPVATKPVATTTFAAKPATGRVTSAKAGGRAVTAKPGAAKPAAAKPAAAAARTAAARAATPPGGQVGRSAKAAPAQGSVVRSVLAKKAATVRDRPTDDAPSIAPLLEATPTHPVPAASTGTATTAAASDSGATGTAPVRAVPTVPQVAPAEQAAADHAPTGASPTDQRGLPVPPLPARPAPVPPAPAAPILRVVPTPPDLDVDADPGSRAAARPGPQEGPAAVGTAPRKAAAKTRASVPAWADVLLGTTASRAPQPPADDPSDGSD